MALPELRATDLEGATQELAPLIRRHAPAAEAKRRLAPEVLHALREAGFFRMFRPRALGGLELDPVTQFRLAEALACVDSAAAWNVQISNASELYGAWFAQEAAAEVFGPTESIVAGAFNPHREAIAEGGGYRITGTSGFNSNCEGATWLIGLADVRSHGSVAEEADGVPDTRLVAVPRRDCEIVPNWNTLGMRGTGSHDVKMDGAFVPEGFAVPFVPSIDPCSAYAGPLYRMAMWVTVGCHAAVALGIARAAIDDLVQLGSRVPAYTQRSLRDRSAVQHRLALADAELASARAYFHGVYDEAYRTVSAGRSLPLETKGRCQQAGSLAVAKAATAVDLVHSCVGTAGVREESNFARYFRDIHVITQHAFVSESRLEAVGQIMLGLEPDWGFFEF